MRKELCQRFWEKVKKNDECWVWIAGKNADGYGKFTYKGKEKLAYHVAWFLATGSWITHGILMHTCDNPACVRIHHLQHGTEAENIKDRDVKGRANKPLGEANPIAILTIKDVAQIKELLKTSLSQREIGLKFGVSASAVGSIKLGYAWSHVI